MKKIIEETIREMWNYELFPRLRDEIRKTINIGDTLQQYPAMMSVSHVAKAMKVSKISVYQWINKGLLKAGVTKSNRIKVDKEELLKFIYARKTKTP